jgi:hypothetical protein
MLRAGSKPITPPGIGSRGAASRHARFAERIAGRYALRSLQKQAQLSLTFARRWTLQTFMHRHWHRSALPVAPRIEIRLQAMRRVIASGGPSGETPLAVSSPRRLNPVRLMAETLIEYVKARARRIEPTARLGSPALPINRPVPRVVRHLAPVSFNAEAVEAGPVRASRRAADRHGTSPGPGGPVMAAPAIDVDRLTEQVIQGIDRRIIARRERLGRF